MVRVRAHRLAVSVHAGCSGELRRGNWWTVQRSPEVSVGSPSMVGKVMGHARAGLSLARSVMSDRDCVAAELDTSTMPLPLDIATANVLKPRRLPTVGELHRSDGKPSRCRLQVLVKIAHLLGERDVEVAADGEVLIDLALVRAADSEVGYGLHWNAHTSGRCSIGCGTFANRQSPEGLLPSMHFATRSAQQRGIVRLEPHPRVHLRTRRKPCRSVVGPPDLKHRADAAGLDASTHLPPVSPPAGLTPAPRTYMLATGTMTPEARPGVRR